MPGSSAAQTGIVFSPPGDGPSYVEAWQNVLHLGEGLDDARLIAEFGCLSGLTADRLPIDQTTGVEVYADVRLAGQVNLQTVRVTEPTLEHLRQKFDEAYRGTHGSPLPDQAMEVVMLRIRRFGKPRD